MFNLDYNTTANEIRLVGTNVYGDIETVISIHIANKSNNKCKVYLCNKNSFNTIFDNSRRTFFADPGTKIVFKERCNQLIDTMLTEQNDMDKYRAIAVVDLIARLCCRVCTKPIGMHTDLVKGWFSDWNTEAEYYKNAVKSLTSLCLK